MGFVALWILAQYTASVPAQAEAASRAELATAAAASPRPRECLPSTGASTADRAAWDRARHPGLRPFCGALARGYALLSTEPARALEAAAAAERALPGRSEAKVLEGRALFELSRFEAAHVALSQARALSTSSVGAPEALYALAASALRTGQLEAARVAYRALAPRARTLAETEARERVYLEAAMLAMRAGPGGLDEALGYLAEARKLPSLPVLADFRVAATALALSRQGREQEAAAVAAEADGPWRLARLADPEETGVELRRAQPFVLPAELDAMVAILASRHDAELASRHWRAALEADLEGPFAEHARRNLSLLERRSGR